MAGPDLALVALTAVMISLMVGGVARASRGTASAPRRASPRLAIGVLAALGLWLGFAAFLAARGWLEVDGREAPRVLVLPLAVLATMVLLGPSRAMRSLLELTPRSWPIAAQTFRVAVELILFALYLEGRAPAQVTFEGRNLDVLVGLTAPLMAWRVARGRASPTEVLAWNAVGLAILANTIGTVVTSVPGALHLDWPGAPFTAITTWPVVWLPAFLAPLAVFLHVSSARQAVGLARGER